MKYLCDPHIIPTNTCPPDSAELARRTERFVTFATDVHLDVSDGLFSPITSWPYVGTEWREFEALVSEGARLPYAETINYEVHLMVQEPRALGTLLARAGCKRLLPHVEAFSDEGEIRETFASWRDAGIAEIGLSLLVDTPLERIEPFIEECAVVQLMSIAKIGAQGQPFDERALSRVEELHAAHPELMVAVDGGITEANVELLVRTGANRLCVGSAISRAPDPKRVYDHMLARAQKGCQPVTMGSSPKAVGDR